MAKVVRAFSLDPEVARMIDNIAEQNSSWEKRSNKSRVVNQALRWYYLTDIAEIISDKDEQIQYWRDKCLSNPRGKGLLARILSGFR